MLQISTRDIALNNECYVSLCIYHKPRYEGKSEGLCPPKCRPIWSPYAPHIVSPKAFTLRCWRFFEFHFSTKGVYKTICAFCRLPLCFAKGVYMTVWVFFVCFGGPINYFLAGPSAISRRALALFPCGPIRCPGGPFRYFTAGPSAI